jgi:LacI family transcriptional regulator
MARKPPTMRDVAIRAGVSPATVSNVLGHRKPVDPVLADRVRQAARDLNYQVDRAASQLRSGRAHVVGVLVPSLENPFFTALIAGIEQAAQEDGYDIIVASSHDSEAVETARMAALLSWRPAGLVIVPATDRFAGGEIIQNSQVPYVVVDRVSGQTAADTVTMDNRSAAAMAARHLLSLGHARALVVASTLELANIRARCRGICETFREAGVAEPEVLEIGMSFGEVGERVERWIADHGRPTSVIALTNYATMGVIAALRRLGLSVPNTVSLIGFDDYTWMQVSSPSITAVAQPVRQMATAAWSALSARIAGEEAPATGTELPCKLEIRQSTRAIGPSLLSENAPAAVS